VQTIIATTMIITARNSTTMLKSRTATASGTRKKRAWTIMTSATTAIVNRGIHTCAGDDLAARRAFSWNVKLSGFGRPVHGETNVWRGIGRRGPLTAALDACNWRDFGTT